MNTPVPHDDSRAKAAAQRVLVDLGQLLAAYSERMVLVGGLSPSLLFTDAMPPHSGSIDVDVALQGEALGGGEYVRLLQTLLDTTRYRLSEDPSQKFRFVTEVDLQDGGDLVEVQVDFLAPKGIKFKKASTVRLSGFRVLEAEGCSQAFRQPKTITLEDMPDAMGALNTVRWRVVDVADLLVMKAYALAGREKLKDAYDIVFCLQQLNEEERLQEIARGWQLRSDDPDIQRAQEVLQEKFKSEQHIGPQWYSGFLNDGNDDLNCKTAHGLVQEFLRAMKR